MLNPHQMHLFDEIIIIEEQIVEVYDDAVMCDKI